MPGKNPHIHSLEVPIVVELGHRRMPLREVMSLLPGAVVDLFKPAEEELDLLVNNQKVATGIAVKIGENFGLRIASIGTPGQLGRAAGAAPAEPPASPAASARETAAG